MQIYIYYANKTLLNTSVSVGIQRLESFKIHINQNIKLMWKDSSIPNSSKMCNEINIMKNYSYVTVVNL